MSSPGGSNLQDLHGAQRRQISCSGLQWAERVGFEPTVGIAYNGFQDRHLRPLGHRSCEPPAPQRPETPGTNYTPEQALVSSRPPPEELWVPIVGHYEAVRPSPSC